MSRQEMNAQLDNGYKHRHIYKEIKKSVCPATTEQCDTLDSMHHLLGFRIPPIHRKKKITSKKSDQNACRSG